MNVLFLITWMFSSFFHQNPDEMAIKAKMQKYDEAVKKMEVETIVNLFTEKGQFGNIIGREAIRKYLNSFTKIKVQKYISVTDKISVHGNVATHDGSFTQIALSNGEKKGSFGTFRIIWNKINGDWKINYMQTEKNKLKQ